MRKPSIVVLAGEELFASFFDTRRQKRLSKLAHWFRCGAQAIDGSTVPALNEADALVTTWDSPYISAENVISMPRVRMIAHCGGEVKKRFEAPLFSRLLIINTPQPMTLPTAELGVALLLYATRNVDYYRAGLRAKSNAIYSAVHLAGGNKVESMIGRDAGMIGFGRVGQAMVEMLRGFGIRWRVFDPYAARALADGKQVRFASLASVLKSSSILVLAAAGTEKTRNLLDRERLALLPDDALIVNVARGSLINLADLTREVISGRLRCALDVTDPEEPLAIGHPLRTAVGAILTPHIGGGGGHARGQMADIAMDQLEHFFRGDVVQNRVTESMLSRMT